MCKGKSLVFESKSSNLTIDHLINIEVNAAYSKGFMKGYNQAEVLKDPKLEADNLAFFHTTCSALSKKVYIFGEHKKIERLKSLLERAVAAISEAGYEDFDLSLMKDIEGQIT